MTKLPPLKRADFGVYRGDGYTIFRRHYRGSQGGNGWTWSIRLDHWEPGKVSEGFSTKTDAHRSALDYYNNHKETTEVRKICSICEGPIDVQGGTWRDGHNAQPVNAGRCCTRCNNNVVIPERLRRIYQ